MALTGEPTFLVVRQARTGDNALERSFTDIDLPERSSDQLAFAARALRSAKAFVTDGRLTWPETHAGGTGAKRQLDSASAARTPFQHQRLGLAGVHGRTIPARVAGHLFMLSDAHGAHLAPGDTLRLELKTSIDAEKSVILFLPIRTCSALPAPQALYCLIAVDSVQGRGWCAQHSSVPQPEGLVTHVRAQGSGIIRRGLFKWRVTQAHTGALAYSICKTDPATEATHIPETIETEF